MKKIITMIIILLFGVTLCTGGVFLLNDFSFNQSENGDMGDGEQPVDPPDEEVEGQSNNFHFTVTCYGRTSSSSVSESTSVGVFDAYWRNEKGESVTWYKALTKTAASGYTLEGGGGGDTYVWNASSIMLKDNNIFTNSLRYCVLAIQNLNDYQFCGFATSKDGKLSNNSYNRSAQNATVHYLYKNLTTTSESTAKSSCATWLNGGDNDSIVFYIIFRKKYTATYMTDGSTYKNNFLAGVGYNLRSNPTKEGYTFKGWYTSSTGGTKYTSRTDAQCNSNHTYYAQWTPNTYEISYNSNGGTACNSNQVRYGDTYGKSNLYQASTRGDLNSLSNNIFSINATNSSSAKIFKNFFQPFDGTFAPSTRYTVIIEVLTFSGGTFELAFVSPNEGGSNLDIATGSVRLNISKAGIYKLNFNTRSSIGEPLYNFRSYIAINANQNAIATFRISVFTGDILYSSFEYATKGNTPTSNILPQPTRTNYTFAGWYKENTYSTKVTEKSTVTTASNHTLYARWEPVRYKLKINYYSQVSTNTTNLSVSAPNLSPTSSIIGLNESAEFSHIYTDEQQKLEISTTSDSNYYLKVGGIPTTSSYDGINSFTYTWTPDSNDTINIYVKERYTVSFNGNGYTSGTVPSTMYKIHGIALTIPSNTLTRTGYTANGWNTKADGSGTAHTTSYGYSTGDVTLYAQWKANSYTVSFDSNGGSSASSKTVTYDSIYGTLSTPTRTGCTFGGWYTNENFTTKVTSSTVVKTAGNHTLYAKWIDDGANDLKYDSTEKYFYFEDGKYPQTYVGTALNNTLNSASVTQNGTLKYFNGTRDITIPIYTYSGAEYAKLVAGKTMTLTMSGGSFTFTSGQSYWFKVEPIRWRVSEYGVSSTAYPSGFASYGSTKTNFNVVSDRILTIGAVTNSDTKEGWSFTSSKLYSNVLANSTHGLSYHVTSGNVSYDEFGSASGNIKVTSSDVAYTGIRVASETDIKTSFTDMSAKASDMVMFLLGTDEQYVDYWTRDLITLNNGKVVTSTGQTKHRWLYEMAGVRFAMTMKEGVRVSQS